MRSEVWPCHSLGDTVLELVYSKSKGILKSEMCKKPGKGSCKKSTEKPGQIWRFYWARKTIQYPLI